MLLYFSKNFSATASGTAIKQVSCEKCSTVFFYNLTRMGTGKSTAPYMIGLDAARRRAEVAAGKDLQKRLHRDQELVPCPNCHWVNESAIRTYRKSKHKGFYVLAAALLGVGITAALIAFLVPTEPAFPLAGLLLLAGTGLAVVAILVQVVLRWSINPNQHTLSGLPQLPPGTPPALIKDAADQLVRAPGDLTAIPATAEFALFRAGQLTFDPLCCQCLEPATAEFSLPATVSTAIAVPLCTPCKKQLQRRFWVWNILIVPPCSFLAAWLISVCFASGVDEAGRTILTVVAGIVLLILGICLVAARLTPYRSSTVDSSRAIFKISFRNPAYTALLIRRMAKQEGID